MTQSLLIQFARAPVAGRVKTRLRLPDAEALAVHGDLVRLTCTNLLAAELGPVELAVTGEPDAALFRRCTQLGASGVVLQQGADLGERMYHALDAGLACAERVLLVGSDCPHLDAQYLHGAAAALDDSDIVLGPALDGGYVLIGARRISETVFEGVTWGSDRVLAQTLSRVEQLGWSVATLEPRRDIDRPEDLVWWRSGAGS